MNRDDYEGFEEYDGLIDGWEDYVGFGESVTKEWT